MSNEILKYLEEKGPATMPQIAKSLKSNPDFLVQDLKVLVEDGDVTCRSGLYDIAPTYEKPVPKKTGPVKAPVAVTKQAPAERQIDSPSSVRFAIQNLEQKLNQPAAPALTDKALKLEVLEQLAKLMSDDIAEVLMEIGSDLSALPEAADPIDGVAA